MCALQKHLTGSCLNLHVSCPRIVLLLSERLKPVLSVVWALLCRQKVQNLAFLQPATKATSQDLGLKTGVTWLKYSSSLVLDLLYILTMWAMQALAPPPHIICCTLWLHICPYVSSTGCGKIFTDSFFHVQICSVIVLKKVEDEVLPLKKYS